VKPTEHEVTVAVDAAARHLHQVVFSDDSEAQTYDELAPTVKNVYREQILGPVIAALNALPNRALHGGRLALLQAAEDFPTSPLLTREDLQVWLQHRAADLTDQDGE
jgi:hypothetical protein